MGGTSESAVSGLFYMT